MMVLQTVQMGPKEKQKLTEESSWCRLLKWVPMKNKNWLPGIIMVQIFQMGTHEKQLTATNHHGGDCPNGYRWLKKKLTRDHTKTLQLRYQHDPSMGSMGSSKQTFWSSAEISMIHGNWTWGEHEAACRAGSFSPST
jgi:hypothetical protein